MIDEDEELRGDLALWEYEMRAPMFVNLNKSQATITRLPCGMREIVRVWAILYFFYLRSVYWSKHDA
jgi:hypothetical protein